MNTARTESAAAPEHKRGRGPIPIAKSGGGTMTIGAALQERALNIAAAAPGMSSPLAMASGGGNRTPPARAPQGTPQGKPAVPHPSMISTPAGRPARASPPQPDGISSEGTAQEVPPPILSVAAEEKGDDADDDDDDGADPPEEEVPLPSGSQETVAAPATDEDEDDARGQPSSTEATHAPVEVVELPPVQQTAAVLELTCEQDGPLGIDYANFPIISGVQPGSWADQWQQRTGNNLVGTELVAIQGQPLDGANTEEAGRRFRAAGRPISLSYQVPEDAEAAGTTAEAVSSEELLPPCDGGGGGGGDNDDVVVVAGVITVDITVGQGNVRGLRVSQPADWHIALRCCVMVVLACTDGTV
jgi:hypothetical protein